jgi:SOUL heme-binding protein
MWPRSSGWRRRSESAEPVTDAAPTATSARFPLCVAAMSLPAVLTSDLPSLPDLEKRAKGFVRGARRIAAKAVAASAGLGALRLIRHAAEQRRSSRRKKTWVAAGLGVAMVGLAGWQLQRLFASEPDYEIEARRGDLEIRRYGRIKTAHTTVGEPWESALDEGFRRLARFILGDNAAHTKVTMTAPVTAARDEAGYRLSFVMPDGVLLPRPDDARISFAVIPARRLAVLRFRGPHDSASIEAKKRALVASAEEAGYVPRGEPSFAGYDPPSTLPALRRNEVWLELED